MSELEQPSERSEVSKAFSAYSSSDSETRAFVERRLDVLERRRDRERRLEYVGLISGFVIALAFLSVSAWLIQGGHEVGGTVLGTVDIVGLFTVFVVGRSRSI